MRWRRLSNPILCCQNLLLGRTDLFASELGSAFGEFDVELLGLRGFTRGAGAGEPVGEDFAIFALGFEGFEELADPGRDVFAEDAFEFETGKAITAHAAADEHGVFVRRTTDKTEVSVVRAATTIRAACHAEEDGLFYHAKFTEDRVDLVHDAWEGAFGLTEAQTAGRQGDASVGDFAGTGHVITVDDAVLGEDGIDLGFVGGIDVGEDQIGVRRDDDRAFHGLGYLTEAGSILRLAISIGDAAHADKDGAVELAVTLLVPTEGVFDAVEFQFFGWEGFDAGQAADDFGAEAVDAHGLHGVLHACVFALGAVAMITLGGDDGLSGINDVGALHIKEWLAEEGPRAELAMAHAESATDGDGVAFDFTIYDMWHKAAVLGVKIDVVAGLDSYGDLEFTREINLTIDGIFTFRGCGGGADIRIHLRVLDPLRVDLFAIKPHVGISGGAPEEALADFFRELLSVGVDGVLDRCRRAHGIADDIAAGTHGAKAAMADVVDDFFEAAFEHAMELDALTIGQAHVAHGLGAKLVMDEPLFGADSPAGHFAADHEAPSLVELGFIALGSLIAVVLLITAMKFEQHV